jgi:SAM-dependent methyltransferase
MTVGSKVGAIVRGADKRFGVISLLNGEPRPPRGGFDLDGEKLLDWAWVCTNLPPGPKRALEIGPGKSPIIPAMLSLGYEVTAIDNSIDPAGLIDGFRFIRGDFTDFSSEQRFDVIVACSVIEHIGLAGRYNSNEDVDGDLKAMLRIHHLLEPGGRLLITIPVGRDAVHKPWHRVYGRERLPRLFEGFTTVKSRFFEKQPGGPWFNTTQEKALETPVNIRRYSLGEMLLHPHN